MIIAPRNWFGQPMHRHAPPKAIAVPGRRSSRPLSPPCPFVQFGASCNAQACGCIHPGHGEIVIPSARIPGPSGKMPAISASQWVRQRLPTGCGSCATIAAWQRWPIIPTIRRKARLPPPGDTCTAVIFRNPVRGSNSRSMDYRGLAPTLRTRRGKH